MQWYLTLGIEITKKARYHNNWYLAFFVVIIPKGENMNQLLGAILLQAVKDLDDQKFESDAKEFFTSEWFEILAEELEINPASIRKQILDGSYQRVVIRAGYH